MVVAIYLPTASLSQMPTPDSRIKKPLIYQIGDVVHIHADGPRPLLLALDALQEKYGWIVNYEDAEYPANSGLSPNPPSQSPHIHANVRRRGGGGFSVEFNVGPTPDSRPDEYSVLTAVVNAYNEGNATAQFELRTKNEKDASFDVVGVGIGGQGNEIATQQPILDLSIMLATELRTVEETIASICQKLSERSKVPVIPGEISNDVHGRSTRPTIAVGGVGVPARTLLSRTLTFMGDGMGWRLLYDSSSKNYELNVIGPSQSAKTTN